MINAWAWLSTGGICEGVAFCGSHIPWASAYLALAPPTLLVDWRQDLVGCLSRLAPVLRRERNWEHPLSSPDLPHNWSRTSSTDAPWRRITDLKSYFDVNVWYQTLRLFPGDVFRKGASKAPIYQMPGSFQSGHLKYGVMERHKVITSWSCCGGRLRWEP